MHLLNTCVFWFSNFYVILEGSEFFHLESVNFLDHMDRILKEKFRASVVEDCLDMKGLNFLLLNMLNHQQKNYNYKKKICFYMFFSYLTILPLVSLLLDGTKLSKV